MKPFLNLRASVCFLVALGLNAACGNAALDFSDPSPTNVLNPSPSPSVQQPTPAPAPQESAGSGVNSGNANAGGSATPPACALPALPEKRSLNIQYQNLANVSANLQSLDVYMPAVANPCQGVPVVIWVHGGAWMLGDKAEVDDKVRLFNGLGYAFVSVNYRLSPDLRVDSQLNPNRIRFPDHPNDVGAAVAWVHKNIKSLGGDPQKLALLGHSAGAHLAALVAMDQTYIQKVDPNWQAKSLRCLGSYDTEAYNIPEFMRTASGQPLLVYRNAFGDDSSIWASASPINFIKEYGMPVQLARRGELDRQAQLLNFKTALEAKKNNVNVIDAFSLTHTEVNRFIGMPGEQIMTPAVSKFVRESCFP